MPGLLDLGFLEVDVFAHDRIIFPNRHFFGHGAAVLFGHIEKAGVCRREQFDLYCYGLGHERLPWNKKGALACAPPKALRAALAA
jgi:hypothetical protein